GLYKNLLEVFKYTPYVGVGCSEVDMAWQKRYCPRCKQRLDAGETQYDIYYKHVSNCTKAVEAAAKELGRDVKPLMWADEFYCGYDNKRWVGIENIPKNVLMGHWQYWSRYQEMTEQKGWEKDYNGITGLLERGFDVFFVSASFEFNTYIHDLTPDEPKDGKWNVLYDAGIYNIADQAKWADVHNKEGHPGKVVGGVCATFSQHDIRGWDTTWYAFVLQGEYTWGDPARPLVDVKKTFTDNFAATFYGARDKDAAETIAAAFGDLDAAKSDLERNNYLIRDFIGEYDIHDNFYKGNNLIKSLKLIDDLTATPQGPGKTIKDIRLRAEKAVKVARSYRSKLAALTPRVENNYSLHYLVLAAHRIENHAMRTLYMLDQQETLAKLSVAKDAQAKIKLTREINELDARLDALRRDTRVIADEMDQLAFGSVATLPRDTTGCHKVLAYLAEFKKMLDKTKGQ
ncbi:MAG: hypothetical protein WCL39_13045, partial [Armatimonadota bacterium]